MDRENINYKTSGFLKDAKYTADLYQFLCEYKDKFEAAESLNVYLDEIQPSQAEYLKEEPIHISEDGTTLTIKLQFFKYKDNRGRITGKPEPFEMYQQLKFILDKAVKEYRAKYISH